MKFPNYNMLRLILVSENQAKLFSKDGRMPIGYMWSKRDIDIIPTLAVLNYIYGEETQWSCQGNHESEICRGYILLSPSHCFPESLMSYIKGTFIIHEVTDDYDMKTLLKTDKNRHMLKSCEDIESEDLLHRNQRFTTILNQWATIEIKKHIKLMKNEYLDKSFNKLFEIYL